MRFMLGLILALSSTYGLAQFQEKEFIGSDKPTYTVKQGLEARQYATGLKLPKDLNAEKAKLKSLAPEKLYQGELPAKFDWRDKGLTPIRDQGNCGSCWAFSLTATLADNIKLRGLGDLNLAEQLLVSCDDENSGCGGGWLGFHYFKKNGSTLEENFPYTASNQRCKAVPFIHKIQDWKYIQSEDGIPAIETLKRVIYTWGPVTVAVSASGDFMNYDSGIYNGNSSGSINHAVNLVGWDDTAAVKHWVMRNSWGTGWGDNGWMKIAYGAKKIGYGGTYIMYNDKELTPVDPTPPPPPPPPPGPTPSLPWAWIIGGLLGLALLTIGILAIVARKRD